MKKVVSLVGLLGLLLGGCGHRERGGWLMDGHPFPSPKPGAVPVRETAMAQVPPREPPIMRVVAGEQVSGLDEARGRVAAEKPQGSLGLRTNVEQLAMREVPLVQLAAVLSEMSGFNIAVSREAAEIPVSVYLQDIPLRQALEAICRLNDLWYREDERVITLMTTKEYSREMVVRRNEKSRAYWLRYSNANDMAKVLQAVMGAKVQFKDIGTEAVYGHVNEKKESGKTLQSAGTSGKGAAGRQAGRTGEAESEESRFSSEEIKQLLGVGKLGEAQLGNALDINRQIEKVVPAVITVFKRNNSIIARSLDETVLEDIGRIIELMDTPTSQVLLEMSILQITLNDGFESFFDLDFPGTYKYTYPDSLKDAAGNDLEGRQVAFTELKGASMGASSGLASQTLRVLFGNHNIQARLELYAKDDRVKILATPYLMSANNSKVEFFVGEEVPLRDDVESKVLYNNEGEVTTSTFEVKIKREELGTDIDISSFINEDGTITMDLEAELSFAQYNMTTIGVINTVTGAVVSFPLDGVDRSKLTSIVTAASGQTIAIGGIIKEKSEEYEKKVPVLGDIPVAGFFFKEVLDAKVKTETVILLTPHIIRHPNQAGRASADFLERRSSHPRVTQGLENILDYPAKTREPAHSSTVDNDGSSGAFAPGRP